MPNTDAENYAQYLTDLHDYFDKLRKNHGVRYKTPPKPLYK